MPRRFSQHKLVRLVAALVVVTGGHVAHAQSSAIDGTAALGSQLVDRGLAITAATPTIQGSVAWTSPSGWSLGAAAGTEAASPGKATEALVQIARSWALSGNWQMQASASYYRYSRRDNTRVYDRSEAGASWIYRDVVTLGVSAVHVLGAEDSHTRPAVDIDVHWPLMWQLSVSAGAGAAYAVTAPYLRYGREYGGVSFYHYGHAGLMWAHGAWRVELDRIATDLDERRAGRQLTLAPWLATISWSF